MARSPASIRITALVALVSLIGCWPSSHQHSQQQAPTSDVRNTIVLIGDGMGPQQLALADMYYQRTNDKRMAALARFLRSATHGTHVSLPERSLVNDSACAASQIAGGCRCEPRQVGIDVNGKRCASVALEAKRRGMKVGLVSDTRITHATPAAFAAASRDREYESEIAGQLVGSGVDLMLSGGLAFFLPNKSLCADSRCHKAAGSIQFRADGQDLVQEAQRKGFTVALHKRELEQVQATPVLGLFAPLHMNDAFDEGRDDEPSLAMMTRKALSLLENPQGFFLMVESGQIDTAAHYNDVGWVFAEMLRLSSMLEEIERFTKGRNDTLVVMTADHETGGMGFSYRNPKQGRHKSPREMGASGTIDFISPEVYQQLKAQKKTIAETVQEYLSLDASDRTAEALGKILHENIGVQLPSETLRALTELLAQPATDTGADSCSGHSLEQFYPYPNFHHSAMVARAISATYGVVWATGTHTSTPVALMAKGPQAERFAGWHHIREVGEKLLSVLAESGGRAR
jgi:alkaline phosphatase